MEKQFDDGTKFDFFEIFLMSSRASGRMNERTSEASSAESEWSSGRANDRAVKRMIEQTRKRPSILCIELIFILPQISSASLVLYMWFLGRISEYPATTYLRHSDILGPRVRRECDKWSSPIKQNFLSKNLFKPLAKYSLNFYYWLLKTTKGYNIQILTFLIKFFLPT